MELTLPSFLYDFGFSYVGLIFLLMLFIPNIIWSRHMPENYTRYVKNENKVLLIFERIGEVLVSTCALVFKSLNIRLTWWALWLLAAFLFMILYEIYWIRYFKSAKKMSDFYSSILGIPLAGATLPVLAFFLLSIYAKNYVILAAVVILGIGHIGIHYCHYKESKQEM